MSTPTADQLNAVRTAEGRPVTTESHQSRGEVERQEMANKQLQSPEFEEQVAESYHAKAEAERDKPKTQKHAKRINDMEGQARYHKGKAQENRELQGSS